MIFKYLEIRDRGTCIAALALKMTSQGFGLEANFHRREGYPQDGSGIILMRLSDQKATSDPYQWPTVNGDSRTMPRAHLYILEHWNELHDGSVVDVRVILGEETTPAPAEIGRAM